MLVDIVIPSYKEHVNKDDVGKQITDLGIDCNLILSTDDFHNGKGFAIKDGLRVVKGEYILITDADLQIPLYELKNFLKVMELYNADCVIGNKRHPYSNVTYTPWRKFVSFGYRFLTSLLFNSGMRDTQCGFKLFKREPLMLIMDKVKTDRYAFDLEVLIALKENGFRIADAPVYVKKQLNRGSVSIKNIFITLSDVIYIWTRYVRGLYKA